MNEDIGNYVCPDRSSVSVMADDGGSMQTATDDDHDDPQGHDIVHDFRSAYYNHIKANYDNNAAAGNYHLPGDYHIFICAADDHYQTPVAGHYHKCPEHGAKYDILFYLNGCPACHINHLLGKLRAAGLHGE